MEDIPIKIRSTQTFTDTPLSRSSFTQSQSQSQSPPPVGDISDVDLPKFFEQAEPCDINSLDSLTALSLLDSMLTGLLQWTRPGDVQPGEAMKESDSIDTDCSNDDDESPLSPKKRRWSNGVDADNVNGSTHSLQTNKTPELNPVPSGDEPTSKSASPPSVRKNMQDSHLAKRFSLNADPGITTSHYLNRINKYCQLSTAVYLAAAYYIHKLVVQLEYVKLTNLNVHRLIISALRLACKTLEDINHRQQFIAKMGGVNVKDLHSLEISFLFLLKFNCQVNREILSNTVQTIKTMYYENQNNITSITNQ